MNRRSLSEIRDELDAASSVSLKRLIAELADDPRSGAHALLERARARADADAAETRRLSVLYRRERAMRRAGVAVIAGLDEVGRGALAGPLTAAAVVLPNTPCIRGLDDSKRLTPARRERVAYSIRETALAASVAHVSAADLDLLGMTGALRRAMLAALDGLGIEPGHVLLDGLPLGLVPRETAVVSGDSLVAAIAAASVIAKVERDALMGALAEEYPGYGFAVNKGYGTAEHLEAIDRLGLSPVHRKSFGPCADTLRLFEL